MTARRVSPGTWSFNKKKELDLLKRRNAELVEEAVSLLRRNSELQSEILKRQQEFNRVTRCLELIKGIVYPDLLNFKMEVRVLDEGEVENRKASAK